MVRDIFIGQGMKKLESKRGKKLFFSCHTVALGIDSWRSPLVPFWIQYIFFFFLSHNGLHKADLLVFTICGLASNQERNKEATIENYKYICPSICLNVHTNYKVFLNFFVNAGRKYFLKQQSKNLKKAWGILFCSIEW